MKFRCDKPLGEYIGLREKYKQLQIKYDRQVKHTLHTMIENLMLTETNEYGVVRELDDYFNTGSHESCFAALLICSEEDRSKSDGITDTFEIICNQFDLSLGQYASLVYFNSHSPSGVGCLIVHDNLTKDDVELLGIEIASEIAELSAEAVAELSKLNIKVRCYVSTLEFGTENIKRLYRETVITHDHSYNSTKAVTTSYDLRANRGSLVNTDVNIVALERQFMNFVVSGRFFEAVTVFDTIIDHTLYATLPTLDALSSSVFARLETVMALSGISTDADSTPVELGNVLGNIMRANDFGQIRDCIHDFFAILEDSIEDSSSQSKITKVLEYINENYHLVSMGAALVCSEFRFSASYLSRLFKTEQGVSIVDYIHAVRIEQAKLLLANSDETIDDIARKVGFSNRWTLIRVFKKLEGVTPGAYRDNL